MANKASTALVNQNLLELRRRRSRETAERANGIRYPAIVARRPAARERSCRGLSDAGFAQAFADLLVGKDLIDPAAIGRARRAAEAASERFDLVLVKLGLISEADLCLAYATYCGLPLIEAADLPSRPVLADRLQLSFLKTNRILPISFDGRRLVIATADPFVDESVKAISYMLDVRVDLAVIAPAEIERALRTLYQDAASETPS